MSTEIDDFFKTATDEQKGLLKKIVETAEDENKLCDKINSIYNSINRGGTYSPDGVSITVCEDKDDAKIISAKPKQELESIRTQIAEYMKQAVELGMGHLGIIKRRYKDYVGEEIPAD